MAGITTADTVEDRIRDLLRQYVNAELALVDTRNNAVAGAGSDNNFTTPSVASDDVQSFSDRRPASEIRVVVLCGLVVQDEEYQELAVEGLPTTHPRLDRSFDVSISVVVSSAAGADKLDGARRRCNRVGEAVRVVMASYGQLSIPATGKAALAMDVYWAGDAVPDLVAKDGWQYWRRDLRYRVRLVEHRA